MFRVLSFGMIVCSFNYLAMLKPKAKNTFLYKSIEKYNTENQNKKHNRNITAPIYDFNFMKEISITKLTSKHSSWKISCAFTVRGHYRHYSNGKIVFIKSYIKGKDKDFQNQTITLAPNE